MKHTNKIKQFRQSLNFSQETLAHRAGISKQWVAALEKGRASPSIYIALRIAFVFETGVMAVFQLTTQEKREIKHRMGTLTNPEFEDYLDLQSARSSLKGGIRRIKGRVKGELERTRTSDLTVSARSAHRTTYNSRSLLAHSKCLIMIIHLSNLPTELPGHKNNRIILLLKVIILTNICQHSP